MAERGIRGAPAPLPKNADAGSANGDRPTPTGAHQPAPIVIPNIPWSSAPPPMPPRSFSTAPPPTPGRFMPVRSPAPPRAAPPAPRAPQIQEPDEEDEESTHAWVDEARRAEEIKNQARNLVQDAMGEALAPLHYAVRDLERRLDEIERRMQEAPPPVPMARGAIQVVNVSQLQAHTPHAPPPPPSSSSQVFVGGPPPARPIPPPPQAYAPPMIVVPAPPSAPRGISSVDTYDYGDMPFDGRRRRRRVILFFAVLFALAFGGMLIAMIASRTPVGH